MNVLLPTALALLGLASGFGIGREWEQLYPTQPTPRYVQDDCWVQAGRREPWEVYPDGRILHVGNWHYLIATRERINSNAKYDGNKPYAEMVKIADFDQHTTKTVCPKGWK